jgi:hypothetical protein
MGNVGTIDTGNDRTLSNDDEISILRGDLEKL